ncbi:hypothetical protein QJQ45_030418 [Haematococcus lacustris]|nr:hypothetical protein QJQ45_030418 [Haematococcus lacustris]
MQRIGESKSRPLELCYWPEQGKLPAKGKEYPGLGYKRLRDKPPKAQQQQPAFIPSDSGNTAGMRALRALRALRPLRTISRFPALKDVTETLFQALPLLGAVAALLAFHLYFFSTLGGPQQAVQHASLAACAAPAVALFSDAYHKACYDPTTDSLEPGGDDPDIFSCSRWRQCPAGAGQCTWFDESLATNVAGWSNFGTGLLTVFQCITLTGWNYVMYRSMDSVSPIAAVPFYISLVFIGAFVLVNLFIAVVKARFAAPPKRRSKRREASRRASIVGLVRSALTQASAAGVMRLKSRRMSTLDSHMAVLVAKVGG